MTVIAIDFDGVLAKSLYPKIGDPIQDNVDAVKSLLKTDTCILWTCRTGDQLDEAVKWCKDHGLDFPLINENTPENIKKYGDSRKVFADLYIDDKSSTSLKEQRREVMKMLKVETREFDVNVTPTDGDEEDTMPAVEGYAAVFNTQADIGGAFGETIAPGTFSRALGTGTDVRALFDHKWGNVLGRVSSKTLTLSEDDHGLKFKLQLPDTSVGRDLAVSMQRGDINQCSFGFVVTGDEWDYSNPDYPLRTVTDVDLYEISVVALPAYDDTEASLVRSKGEETEGVIQRLKKRREVLSIIERGLTK